MLKEPVSLPSHGGNRGSSPLGSASNFKCLAKSHQTYPLTSPIFLQMTLVARYDLVCAAVIAVQFARAWLSRSGLCLDRRPLPVVAKLLRSWGRLTASHDIRLGIRPARNCEAECSVNCFVPLFFPTMVHADVVIGLARTLRVGFNAWPLLREPYGSGSTIARLQTMSHFANGVCRGRSRAGKTSQTTTQIARLAIALAHQCKQR